MIPPPSPPPVHHIHLTTARPIGLRLNPEHVLLTAGGTAKILHWGQLGAASSSM